ncbi:MAG: ABC transporter permease subunit [Aphanocapsa feldmannii 277cI]|uniref:ABC transporter permease subunit n=1 Tax=Aphanocapsa feldmannii 277cI TaxID=2507554 RepID=A0A524RUN2_9CHRO|nr:MAG: ABC transporter permease subunit [Aphanocapsa feldmannii 277cI]
MLQGLFGLLLLALIGLLLSNLQVNLLRTGQGLGFGWLVQPAGFELSEHWLPYLPGDSYAWALLVGFVNSLRVVGLGLVASTLVGVVAGSASFSTNLLLRQLAFGYVAMVRNVPLLLQLLFWYFVVFLGLSSTPQVWLGGLLSLSNQGVEVLGQRWSVEFGALLAGLTLFTGAYIAEVVRGGITSAARSLGLGDNVKALRLVVLPQALPAILPGLASQYINLAKNSTLAIAVGYADIYAVSDTTITQTGRAIEGFLVLLLSFLLLDLLISGLMQLLNRMVLRRR